MKSIFHKFTYLYIGLYLLAFVLIVIGVRTALTYYFISHEAQTIEKRVKNYEQVLNSTYIDRISLELLEEQVLLLDGYMGSELVLIDEQGVQYPKVTDAFSGIGSITETEYDEILSGKLHTQRLDDQKILRVGVSLNVRERSFVLLAFIKMPEIEDTISKVTMIVLITLTFSVILAMMFIYLISRKFTKEIKLITESAKRIANGELDLKIRSVNSAELADLANAFNEMAHELKRQEVSKRNFVSSLSHDIRTPLTTIKGYTTGILDKTIPVEKQERYLGIVVSEADRMIKMANDLLDLSKMDSGLLSLHKTDFDISQMILSVLDSFEQTIVEKKVRLAIDFSQDLAMGHADVSAIQRVVYNLLDNATKFVNEGGLISIRTELKGEKIFVGISNTGKVLTKDELESIWDRFTKLDKSRGLEKKSNGLGLSIVKEIIRAHNEKIDVYSNEDIGVAFIFTLAAIRLERSK